VNKHIEIKNKRAYYEYEILNKLTAGIVLTGTEIKSVREGKVSLSEGYCLFVKEELWIKNMHIAEYKSGGRYNHELKRTRKLLLNRKELAKLHAKVKERGFTIVPLQMFITERGHAKVEIGLVRGKKLYDKRASIKEKDQRRDLARQLKR